MAPTQRLVWLTGHVRFRWEATDDLAGLRIRDSKLELRLEIEPELWIGGEPMPKPQCRVAGDSALAGNDLADTIWRHVDLPSERCWANTGLS
jgi:hypothetical protein